MNQTELEVAYESLKTKEKCSWYSQKWPRSLTGAVAYGSGRLRELFIKEFE